ncbi:hypothetical protein LTR66_015826, partial [Elasticomyces elasticus]
MSRRYPVADRNEGRERDYYTRPRQERTYEELDVDITRARYPDTVVSERPPRSERPGRTPDFLRDDYGRNSNVGQLVVRERERDEERWERGSVAPSRAPTRRNEPVEREKIEIDIRERRPERPDPPPPPPSVRERKVEREEIIYRRGEREEPPRPRPREREVDETDLIIRRSETEPRARTRPKEREVEREEIVFRRGEGVRGPASRKAPPREDEEEVTFQHREKRGVHEDQLIIRERDHERPEPPRSRRGSLPPIAREREEFVFRRREPPPPKDYEKEEIIIRRREREPSPEPAPEPVRSLSPEPMSPIIKPPIVQEIITHHRHIDHGIQRARSPTPPPPPPSPPKDEGIEVEIRRRGIRNGKQFYDEDIIYERDALRQSKSTAELRTTRRGSPPGSRHRRSPSPIRRLYDDDNDDDDDDAAIRAEADFYNRKVSERGHAGEAYNG